MLIDVALERCPECIVTRNVRDFRKSPIPAASPSDVVARLA